MPSQIIDVRKADDGRDVVHRAVQALVEGQLVAFPTETVYGIAASALQAGAVDRLIHLKSRDPSKPLTLAIKSAEDAWDYVPNAPPLGRRLARRCWPGPITLVLKDSTPESSLRQLPASVQQAVCPEGTVGLRVPAHDLILDVLDLLAGPIALTSANLAGQPPATTGQDVKESLGEELGLILDDGVCRFGSASSVVQVHPGGMDILREGVVTESALKRMAMFTIVVVCTGNTCRSPMAEVLLQKRLADRLGCTIDQLEDRGVLVASAGIAAASGARASAESVRVMEQKGLDLEHHVSQPINDRMVRHADFIFTMTNGHRAGLLSQWPEAMERTFVLCPDGRDVSDPIGGPMELYIRCADQIDAALVQRVDAMDLTTLCPD